MIYEKTCKHCQRKFESKRRDTKFCSANCRGGYNYWKKNPKKDSKTYVFKEEKPIIKEDGGEILSEIVLKEETPKPWRETPYWKEIRNREHLRVFDDEMIDAYYMLNVNAYNALNE